MSICASSFVFDISTNGEREVPSADSEDAVSAIPDFTFPHLRQVDQKCSGAMCRLARL